MADDTKPKTELVGPPESVPPVKHPPETYPPDKSPGTSGDRSKEFMQFLELDEIGHVERAVLASSDIEQVDIIFGPLHREFVQTNLIKELETHTSLRLEHLEKHVKKLPVKSDSVTIVVFEDPDPVIDKILSGSARRAFTRIIFLLRQVSGRRLDWFDGSTSNFALMIYPRYVKKLQEQFWETLSTMLGDKSRDVTCFSKLNDFGLVQHVVLVLSDLQEVHLLFDARQEDFIYRRLIKELKTRTSLRLEHPKKHVVTAAAKADSVTIVVFDNPDSVIDEMLFNAVDSVGQTDAKIIFLRHSMRGNYPAWVDTSFTTSTRMVCPRFGDVQYKEFWNSLYIMLCDQNKDDTSFSKLDDFSVILHALLVSPDLNDVHVIFDGRKQVFVYTMLIKKLEKHTSLRLEHPENPVMMSSAKADSIIMIVFGEKETHIDTMFENVVGSVVQPNSTVLFLQHCEMSKRPKWVISRLPTSTLMVYPLVGGEHYKFWETLSYMLGDQNKDIRLSSMLNDLGLVRHIVLRSPYLQPVHVIFDGWEREFVSTLISELQAQTTLRLEHQEKHAATSSMSKCQSVTIVVSCKSDPVIDKMFVDAVASVNPTNLILIQSSRSGCCPGWVKESVPSSTVIVYPEVGKKQFWQTLSTLLSDQSKDVRNFSQLNDFCPMQHTVLMSQDRQLVHVIFNGWERDFVYTTLIGKLKLEHQTKPISAVLTNSELESVTIVILSKSGPITDKMFVDTVASLNPTYLIFIQKSISDFYPDWAKMHFPSSTLIVYCNLCIEQQERFWQTLSTALSDQSKDVRRFSKLNDFGPVQHTVLVSPDLQPVHVIFDALQFGFVFNQLIRILEERTTLRLEDQKKHVATTLSSAKSERVTIVVLSQSEPVIDEMFVDAVASVNPTNLICILMSMSTRCPDWIKTRVPSSAVIVYPKFRSELGIQFRQDHPTHEDQLWQTLSTVLSEQNKDVRLSSMLNDFGLIQHTVLVSSDLQPVHVIFDGFEMLFVYTKLITNLEKFTTLRQEKKKKHAATTLSRAESESITIVVLSKSNPVIDKMFVDAVASVNPTNLICILIPRIPSSRTLPDWVNVSVPGSTVIVYPEHYVKMHRYWMMDSEPYERMRYREPYQEDIKEKQFWQTLSTVLSDQSKGVQHFSKLNDFCLIQHTVLRSPDLQSVHVIFDVWKSYFVTDLIGKLETLTTLRLEHQEKHIATSLSNPKSESVTIVVSSKSDPVIDKMFVDAVASVNPANLICILTSMQVCYPDWVKACFLSPTVIVWQYEREQEILQTLSTVLSDKSKDVRRFSKLNDFGPVQHTVLVSPDLQQVHVIFDAWQTHFVYNRLIDKMVSLTTLRLEDRKKHVATNISSAKSERVTIVVVSESEPVIDKLFVDAVASVNPTNLICILSSMQETLPDWVKASFPSSTVIMYPETGNIYKPQQQFWHTLSTALTASIWRRTSATVPKVTQLEVEGAVGGHQSRKDLRFTQFEYVGGDYFAKDSRTTQVEDCDDGIPLSTNNLGSSDEETSENDSDVDMHCFYCSSSSSSTCSQNSSDDEGGEHVETKAWQHPPVHEGQDPPPPILSYSWQAKTRFDHEGGCFQRTGSDVKLGVPPGAVACNSYIEVYSAVSVEVSDIHRLLNLSDEEQVASPFVEFWAGQDFQFQAPVSITLPLFLPKNFDPNLVSVYHVRYDETKQVVVERLGQTPPESNSGAEETLMPKDSDFRKVKNHCFQLEEGHVTVFTEHFCGYACFYCNKKKHRMKRKPELYLMASGLISRRPASETPLLVDVYALIWDRRIQVRDCREREGITIANGQIEYIELPHNWKHSKAEVHLGMKYDDNLTHRTFSNGERIYPGETKSFNLLERFGCKKCAKAGHQKPVSHRWLMKSENPLLPPVEVSVFVKHVIEAGITPEQTTLPLQLELPETQTNRQWREQIPAALSLAENTSMDGLLPGTHASWEWREPVEFDNLDAVSSSASGGGSLNSIYSKRLIVPDSARSSMIGELSGNTRFNSGSSTASSLSEDSASGGASEGGSHLASTHRLTSRSIPSKFFFHPQ